MAIRKLPTLLVNQIAAGEVIERPASVVKELVENSLDAGAQRIEVAVEDGGRELIRVSDDGGGIAPDDLALAVAPHATSKLESAEQLHAIATLGFRGEALASIASVSRLRITSRTRDSDAAFVLEASGDDVADVQPASGQPGTIVEVRDLFFNTPARRRFMRAAGTEFSHISEAIARVAMMHPRVAFMLTHNGRKSLELPPDESRADRCIAILGKDLAEALLEFEHRPPAPANGAAPPASVWGLAGLPSIARHNTKQMHLCVNGRPIRDRNLSHAVKEAYRGLIPPDRHPVVIVFIEMDPAEVDVNVHPAKAEVRFRNPSSLHGLVLSALRQRLLASDLTPSAELRSTMFRAAPEPQASDAPTLNTPHDSPDGADDAHPPRPPVIHNTSEFVDYFRRMDPTQKGFVYEQVKQALADEQPEHFNGAHAPDAPPSPTASPDDAVAAPPILQIRNSYVVTEDDQGLLIVDQHALHERVMFEMLRRRVLAEGKALESQRLLMPEIVDADESRQAALESLGSLLSRIGVEAEPIGPRQIAVHAFPSFLFERKVQPAPFLTELLDKAAAGDLDAGDDTAEEAALHEVLDMMACKAAVKAGDKLSQAELRELLARRQDIERSSNCPHGRPTTLRLTLRDLEKQFGRT